MSVSGPQNQSRKLRGEKRTIPIKGTWDDDGRYFRCWNCGFVVDSKRDRLGDERSDDGTSYEDYANQAQGAQGDGDPLSVAPVLRMIGGSNSVNTLVALAVGTDGAIQPPTHSHKLVGSGCPFCHTLNWK